MITRALGTFVILFALTQIARCESSFITWYGKVNVTTEGMLEDQARTIVDITSWDSSSLPSDIDSVLRFAKNDDGMWLRVPNCQAAEISFVQDVAGRFTPWKLHGIWPTGTD
jgi:hypothetical protein